MSSIKDEFQIEMDVWYLWIDVRSEADASVYVDIQRDCLWEI